MTLVVNLYGGPGTGKSTTAAGLFYRIKKHGLFNVELVTEFAKDLTWEERHNVLANQAYILGTQYHRLMRVYDKVDIIITDGPLLNSVVYNEGGVPEVADLAITLHESLINYDVYLLRTKSYNPLGRTQTEEEAKKLDETIKDVLAAYAPGFKVSGTEDIHVDILAAEIERAAYEYTRK